MERRVLAYKNYFVDFINSPQFRKLPKVFA